MVMASAASLVTVSKPFATLELTASTTRSSSRSREGDAVLREIRRAWRAPRRRTTRFAAAASRDVRDVGCLACAMGVGVSSELSSDRREPLICAAERLTYLVSTRTIAGQWRARRYAPRRDGVSVTKT